MMEYQRTVNKNRQIERKNILSQNDPEEIKKGPNDVRRFMKRTVKTKSGEKSRVEYYLDEEKIREKKKIRRILCGSNKPGGSAKISVGIP